MPVRSVSNRGGNIIGHFPSLKLGRMVEFESLIERDFVFLLDFEPDVAFFVEQPLTIEYEQDGRRRHYTPDFHVVWKRQNILVECKPEQLIHLPLNQAKSEVAREWCTARGWRFQLVTDNQLRSGYRLENVKFLTQFARYQIEPALKRRIHAFLAATARPVTVGEIMATLGAGNPSSLAIPIYHMAYHCELIVSMDDAPISLGSPIDVAGECL